MIDNPLIVAIRLGLYLAIGGVFGVSLFAIYGLPVTGLRALPMRPVIGIGAAVGLALSMLGLAALAAGMADTPLASIKVDDLRAMAGMPGIGDASIARIVTLGGLAGCALILRSGRMLALLGASLGAVALGSLAWNGHGAATEGRVGDLHLASDIGHLLAAGAWLGALGALGRLLAGAKRLRTKEDVAAAHRALEGFSIAGAVMVGIIVATGLVNAWLLVGPDHVQGLRDTLYGRLLLAKLALFLGMILLASINRYRLTPALAAAAHDPRAAIGALRRSLALETAAAVSILAFVAWLGTLMPPTAM